MKNPYEVLGITSSATDDEIKKAYRIKASQYADNSKMMDEINWAYDTIVMSRGASANNSYSYTGSASDDLGDIRAKLNAGRIDDAEMLLDGIPHQRRSGEWYFLKGSIQQRRGWLESAAESFKKASETDPSNAEYKNAYDNIVNARNGDFRRERHREENDGCCDSPCKMCSGLICADCCCECCGGDLIRCC